GNDDYTQPGNLFRLMSAAQRAQLFANIAEAMDNVPERIKARQLAHFYRADPAYARGVAEKLALDIKPIAALARLSLSELIDSTSEENYAGQQVAARPAAAGA
ncbi:MAG: hypothetical protein F4Z60_13895, partial [Chloroflexi bacterium]|nr:hypothetical protein [Chloroflexota bacterium]